MKPVNTEALLVQALSSLSGVKHPLAADGYKVAFVFVETHHQPILESLADRLEPLVGEYTTTYEHAGPPATTILQEISRRLKNAAVKEVVSYSFASSLPPFVLNATGFAIAIASLTSTPLAGAIAAAATVLDVALLIPANLAREKDEYRLRIYCAVLRAGYEKLLELINSEEEEAWLGVLVEDVCRETGMIGTDVEGAVQTLIASEWIEDHSHDGPLRLRPKLELLHGEPELQGPLVSVFNAVRGVFREYLHSRTSKHWQWKPSEEEIYRIVGGDRVPLQQGLEALCEKRILKRYEKKGYSYIWMPL